MTGNYVTNQHQKPIEFVLDGQNSSSSLHGYINMTLTQEEQAERDYDERGAAIYVVAVIMVYGLSMVLLIGSLAKKNIRDKSLDIEEGQVSQYLNDVPNLKERSQRDKYKQLKRNMALIVNSTESSQRPAASSTEASAEAACAVTTTTPLEAETVTSGCSGDAGGRANDTLQAGAALRSKRRGGRDCNKDAAKAAKSRNSKLGATEVEQRVTADFNETIDSSGDKIQHAQNGTPNDKQPAANHYRKCATPQSHDVSTSLLGDASSSWGRARVYKPLPDGTPVTSKTKQAGDYVTFDDPVQEWLFSPRKQSDGIHRQMAGKRAAACNRHETNDGSVSRVNHHKEAMTTQQTQCTCAQLMFDNRSFEPTSPRLRMHQPTTSRLEVHQPTSPRLGMHHQTSPRLGMHHPTSPRLGMHHPTSPRLGIHRNEKSPPARSTTSEQTPSPPKRVYNRPEPRYHPGKSGQPPLTDCAAAAGQDTSYVPTTAGAAFVEYSEPSSKTSMVKKAVTSQPASNRHLLRSVGDDAEEDVDYSPPPRAILL